MVWMAFPFLLLFIWISVDKLHWIYYILLASIPFSTEVELPGGFATDFPDEVIMWWLCFLGAIYILSNKQSVIKLLHHPVTWLLIFHWVWILVCSLGSQNMVVSVKFWLSKSWYLFIFYVLAYLFFKNEKRLQLFVWVSAAAACGTVLIIESKHAFTGFAFNTINDVVRPFYRNHVNYACLMVCIIPYLFPLWKHFRTKPFIRFIIMSMAVVMLLGIGLSYTRAAYIALFSIILIYPILKFKLMDAVTIFFLIVGGIGLIYLTYQNNFLDLAPDYTKAITHSDFLHYWKQLPKAGMFLRWNAFTDG
jgi:hypothetical protein